MYLAAFPVPVRTAVLADITAFTLCNVLTGSEENDQVLLTVKLPYSGKGPHSVLGKGLKRNKKNRKHEFNPTVGSVGRRSLPVPEGSRLHDRF